MANGVNFDSSSFVSGEALQPLPPRVNLPPPAPVDPWAGFEPATPEDLAAATGDEWAGFEEADAIDISTPEELAGQEGFNVVQFIIANPEVQNDPARFNNLLEAYRLQRERGVTADAITEAFKAAPAIGKEFVKGAKDVTERLIEVGLQPAVNVAITSTIDPAQLPAIIAETKRRQRKAVAELSAGSETAAFGLTDLLRTGARKVKRSPGLQQGVVAAGATPVLGLPGALSLGKLATAGTKSIGDLSEAELRAELLEDVEFAKQAEQVLRGQGVAAEAVGLDAEKLAKEGIELDQAAIQAISTVDPLTLVGTGGALSLVTKSGKVLAKVKTVSQAARVAKQLGLGLERALPAGAGAATRLAGRAVGATGRAVERVGQASRGPLKLVGGVAGAAKGGAVGGVGGAFAGVALGTRGAATVARGVESLGKGISKIGDRTVAFGRQIAGELPPGRLLRAVQGVGRAVGPTATGAAVGAASAAPLALLPDTDEQAAQLLAGGIALGGGAGALSTGAKGFTALRDRVVGQRLLEPFERTGPVVVRDSPDYGLAPEIDAIHRQAFEQLDTPAQAVINDFREMLRGDGEIYVQDGAAYGQRIQEILELEKGAPLTPEEVAAAQALAETRAVFATTFPTPDGPRKVVFLNKDARGLTHDAGHLFDAILPEDQRSLLREQVAAVYTPEELGAFKRLYEDALNQDLPEGSPRRELTTDQVLDEVIAENFSALFANVDVSTLGTPRPLMDRLIQTAASWAERAGADLGGGRVTPGGLELRQSVTVQKFLENASRKREAARTAARVEPQGPRVDFTTEPRPLRPEEVRQGVNADTGRPLSPEEIRTGRTTNRPAEPPPVPPGPRNKRVTAAEQAATAAEAPDSTGIKQAQAFAEKANDPTLTKVVNDISASFARKRGEVTPLEFEVLGAKEMEPGRVSTRQQRLEERLAADLAEAAGAAPEDVRELFQAVQVPVRFETVGRGANQKLQLLGMSLDKVMANVGLVTREAGKRNLTGMLPYDVQGGHLTPDAWRQFQKDLVAYTENQQHGYRGDGRRLVRPEDPAQLQVFIPEEDPNFTPTVLPEEVGNFINLIQGIAPPQTARTTPGLVPGNVKAQTIAQLQGREVGPPAKIRARDKQKQTFPTGETIAEVNPLRNQLSEAGFDIRSLHEVTERFRVDRIKKVTPRSELKFRAPNTEVVRAGFLPREPRTGREFDQFFTDVSAGRFGYSDLPFQPLGDLSAQADFVAAKERYAGNFDDHIRKSIPAFYEAQVKKGDAIARVYGETGGEVLDIGGSEGSFGKAITDQSGGSVKTTNLDPNRQMQSVFDATPVEGATFVPEAFLNPFDDVPAYSPDKTFDVINETMAFQFIDPDRASQVKEVKRLLKPEGVALFEEKVRNPNWAENEAAKDSNYKSRYFSQDDLKKKDQRVGFQQNRDESKAVGMVDNMATQEQLEAVLKSNFKHVVQYWDSGNFKGYAASDNAAALNRLVAEMGDMQNPFSTVETPKDVVTAGTPAAGSLPQPVRRAAFLPETPSKEKTRVVAPRSAEVTKAYAEKAGIPVPRETKNRPMNQELMKDLADYVEDAPHSPTDPEVVKSYDAFEREILDQANFILESGLEVEPWTGQGEPYTTAAEMVRDVRDNNHMYFLKTEGGFGGLRAAGDVAPTVSDQIMMRKTPLTIDGYQLDLNEVTRFVHDYFGHAPEGNQFGPRGEFNAFLKHSQFFSPEAQKALAAELLMQAAWFFNGRHLRRKNGSIPVRGDADFIPPQERPFMDPKNVVPTDELMSRILEEVQYVSDAKFLPAEPDQMVVAVSRLNGDDFKKAMDSQEGGLTGAAVRLGKRFNSPEEVAVLQALEEQASREFKDALASGNMDEALKLASKPQFFREARESATNTGSIGEARARGEFGSEPKFLPRRLPEAEEARTDAGRKLIADGYRITREPASGVYGVSVHDGDVLVADITARNVTPDTASIDNVFVNEDYRGQGIAEAIYRETATDMQAAGITKVTGTTISDIPLRIREKVFGAFESVDHPVEGRITGEQAISRLRESREARARGDTSSIEFVEPVSRIRPGARFQPKEKKGERLPLPAKGFIQPDGKFVRVNVATHDDYLIKNADALNKEFGTAIPKKQGKSDPRVNALSKGFVRVSYEQNNGRLVYEANAKQFGKKQQDTIFEHVVDNLDDIDNLTVSLVDDKGKTVKSASRQFFLMDDDTAKLDAIPFVTDKGDTASSRLTPFFLPKDAFTDEGFAGEVSKIASGEKEGETFNVSGAVFTPKNNKVDIVTVASVDIPAADLTPESVKAALEPYSPLLEIDDVKPGLFRIQRKTAEGGDLVSVDVNAVVPKEHRKNTEAFARANNQEAIFDYETLKVVDTGGTGETVLTDPERMADAVRAIVNGEPYDFEATKVQFMPRARRQEELGLEIEAPATPRVLGKSQRAALNRRQLREAFPEAVIPRSATDSIPYAITDSPLYKRTKGSEADKAQAFAERLVEKYRAHEDDPDTKMGLRWYDDFTPLLKSRYGEDAQAFAELLAATSPNTTPQVNFYFADAAFKQWKAGAFDNIITKYREGLDGLADGSLLKKYEQAVPEGERPAKVSPATLMGWWIDSNDLLPRQAARGASRGPLFGMHSKAVLKVITRQWLDENRGLKTNNFVRNLLGESEEATIDLWAARTMREAGYSEFQDRWRILPENATAVSDADFKFSQEAFRAAAEELGLKPSQLQGALWFIEKKLWAEKGWSELDLGDYRTELRRTEERDAPKLPDPQGELF